MQFLVDKRWGHYFVHRQCEFQNFRLHLYIFLCLGCWDETRQKRNIHKLVQCLTHHDFLPATAPEEPTTNGFHHLGGVLRSGRKQTSQSFLYKENLHSVGLSLRSKELENLRRFHYSATFRNKKRHSTFSPVWCFAKGLGNALEAGYKCMNKSSFSYFHLNHFFKVKHMSEAS